MNSSSSLVQPSAQVRERMEWSLPNGLTCVTVASPGRRTAGVTLTVRAGAAHEPDSRLGLAHLTEHVLAVQVNGSYRPVDETPNFQFHSKTDLELTQYSFVTVAEQLVPLLAFVRQFAAIKGTSKQQVDLAARRVVDEQSRAAREPVHRVFALLREGCHPSSRLSRSIHGTQDTVGRISAIDVLEWLARAHTPGNCSLSVVSPYSNDEISKPCATLFDDWAGCVPDFEGMSPEPFAPGYSMVAHGETNELLVVGFPGVAYGDQDYWALVLVADMLAGAPSATLFRKLRIERQLAYGTNAFFFPTSVNGVVAMYCSATSFHAMEALKEMLSIAHDLEVGKIGQAELDAARIRVRTRAAASADQVQSHAEMLGRRWALEGSAIRDADMSGMDLVSTDDVSSAIRRLDWSKCRFIAGVGPLSTSNLDGLV